jgi:hypothetical protein
LALRFYGSAPRQNERSAQHPFRLTKGSGKPEVEPDRFDGLNANGHLRIRSEERGAMAIR